MKIHSVVLGVWFWALFAVLGSAWAACPNQGLLIERLGLTEKPQGQRGPLLRLKSTDPRERWLAAGWLGQNGRIEAVPHLVRQLGDENLEVRRRAREALLKLSQGGRSAYFKSFKSSIKLLDPVSSLVAQGILAQAKGRADAGRQYYNQAFFKDNNRLWAAIWSANIEENARAVQKTLASEIAVTISLLMGLGPDPEIGLTMLRQAHGLTILAETFGRQAGSAARDLLRAGRKQEAEALDVKSVAKLVSAALQMNQLAKDLEAKIKAKNPGFMPSDFDPSYEKDLALAQARARAADALAKCRSGQTASALTASLSSDPVPMVRARAARSLGLQNSDSASEALLSAFKVEADSKVKKAIIQALGHKPIPQSRRLVYGLVKTDQYKVPALLAIGRMGEQKDIDFLRRVSRGKKLNDTSSPKKGYDSYDRQTVLMAAAQGLELAADKQGPDAARGLRQEADLIRQQAFGGKMLAARLRPKQKSMILPPDPAQAAAIEKMIGLWIDAWSQDDLDRYFSFYHPNFRYKGMNLEGFKAYKMDWLGKFTNVKITAKEMRIQLQGGRAFVTFVQDFVSDQYRDYGLKSLTLEKSGGKWLIVRQKWEAMPRQKK